MFRYFILVTLYLRVSFESFQFCLEDGNLRPLFIVWELKTYRRIPQKRLMKAYSLFSASLSVFFFFYTTVHCI